LDAASFTAAWEAGSALTPTEVEAELDRWLVGASPAADA
jgi:hypothetical protein